jgi:hypothetical protein
VSALSRGTEAQRETTGPDPKAGFAKGEIMAGSDVHKRVAIGGELTDKAPVAQEERNESKNIRNHSP